MFALLVASKWQDDGGDPVACLGVSSDLLGILF